MFFKRHVALTQEYLGFLLLNLFDLFMTGYIFQHQGIEANKVANWVLQSFGYHGFATYKFLLVTVVVLACEGISIKAPKKAKMVVMFGCIILTLVVCYEGFLIITGIHMRPKPAPVPDVVQIRRAGSVNGGRVPVYEIRRIPGRPVEPGQTSPEKPPLVPDNEPKVGADAGGKAGK